MYYGFDVFGGYLMTDFSAISEDIKYLKKCLADLNKKGNPGRIPAYWNIITFGRMVTFHLQKQLKYELGFKEWYSQKQIEMREDSLLKFFVNARNELEKEGRPAVTNVTQINHFESPKDLHKFGPPPPNSKGFFIGDNLGGSGWIVSGPDGNNYKIYVELPQEIGNTWMIVKNLPDSHLGVKLKDRSVEAVCKIYVDYLANLVQEAMTRFK